MQLKCAAEFMAELGKHTHRKSERQRDGETERPTDRETYRHINYTLAIHTPRGTGHSAKWQKRSSTKINFRSNSWPGTVCTNTHTEAHTHIPIHTHTH